MDGVIFDDKHSLRDLNMYLKRKVVSAPTVQTNYIEVPQRDGKLDLTEGLTGIVKYYNRTISMQFVLIDDDFSNYQSRFSAIENILHGKKVRLIFDDDSGYFYTGRLTVTTSETDKKAGIINISADCEPYKRDVNGTDEEWFWDTFDLENGVINESIDVTVNGSASVTIVAGLKVTYPVIYSNAAMTVSANGETFNIVVGTNKMYDMLLPKGNNVLTFQGSGSVSIKYKGGIL